MKKKNAPIKVLFYEPYPMGLGGNFQTQKMILERLDRIKLLPIVMAPAEGVALDRFRAMGVECSVMPPPTSIGSYGGIILKASLLTRLKSAFHLLKYNFQIARFIRQNNIDVVYANCVRAQMQVGLGALFAGVPSLLYVKGELTNPLIDRVCFFLASKIIFFCRSNRDDKYPLLVRWFKRKIEIVSIGFDPALIESALTRGNPSFKKGLMLESDSINTVVVGQLYKPKGQHFAIEALARLIPDFPNVKLYLLGDHVIEEYRFYRAELEKMIAGFGLRKNVVFMGWRKDALDVVSVMDIVIHPSLAEGFGRAVLEAMALGKPVVASAVGGLREAVKDGENGFLIPPGDVMALTECWRKLLSDAALRLRLGKQARYSIFAEYLIDDKVKLLSNIWLTMAKRKDLLCAG